METFIVKKGSEWSWGYNKEAYHSYNIHHVTGKYEIKKVRRYKKIGVGFEGVGGRDYTVYKVKIYKDFVGKITQWFELKNSNFEDFDVLFDNTSEAKEKMLKEYLSTIHFFEKKVNKIGKWIDLGITLKSDLFSLKDYINFCNKDLQKYQMNIYCEKKYHSFINKYYYKLISSSKVLPLQIYFLVDREKGQEKSIDEYLDECEITIKNTYYD